MQRCVDGGSVVASKEPSLQLSGPIPELGQRQKGVACQMALESEFIKLSIVEATKCRGQAKKSADQPKLRNDEVNHKAEARFSRKRENMLCFLMHLSERISHGQEVRDQLVAAISRKGKITDTVGGIEGATHQRATFPGMPRPWQDDISKTHIGSCLITLQATFFDQVVAKPAKSKAVPVVAEARSGYDGKPYVSEARRVAVAVLVQIRRKCANCKSP
jgi:hypothetical protein